IGMVCEAALPAPPLDKRQAEVIVSRQQRDWERHLLRCLLQQEDLWDTAGESAKRGRHVALVGEGRA
ncbi:MAG: hypothetical protein N3A66_04240, partial [Planctomycetota bacterium]|nr:hypothetical protein [Planctomycetota bacterium]